MSKQETHCEEFLIKRDGEPVKCMNLPRLSVTRFMQRLNMRFPDASWSISSRFPIYGAD